MIILWPENEVTKANRINKNLSLFCYFRVSMQNVLVIIIGAAVDITRIQSLKT